MKRPMLANNPVLILGGTAEAAALAGRLTAQGLKVITSLAGRTRDPAPLPGETRIGGFGGVEGLASYLRDNQIVVLVDATHPFAAQMSANAPAAAEKSGTPRLCLERPAWRRQADDNWIDVGDEAAATAVLPAGARAFLALGSQHLAPFAKRDNVHFVLRMVDEPRAAPALASHEIVPGLPGDIESETALLRGRRITHLVCRNSGGDASYAKIVAARDLGIPVIMIRRPAEPVPPVAQTVEEAVAFIESVLSA